MQTDLGDMGCILRRTGWVAVLLVVACERPAPARSNDTAVPTAPPPETAVALPTPPVPAWDTAAGPVFFVVGPNAQQAAVIVPGIDTAASLDTVTFDVARYRSMPLDLFAAGRRLGAAAVGATVTLDVPEDCSAWPMVRLNGLADSSSTGWTIAFRSDRFEALGVDSLVLLPRADSLRIVTDLARVASAAPGDTVQAMRGIPFVVRRAYRATLPGGIGAVIAEVGRSLNQEANPLQEHLLMIAERDSTSRSYRLAYLERSAGGEEMLESSELLLIGVPRGREQPMILLARYLGDGVVYSMLERAAAGTWRLRWSSPYAGC
jgi:hypothetical protein